MKLQTVFPLIILIALLGMPCAKLFAFDKEMEGKPLKKFDFESISVFETDSIPVKKPGDKKEQDRPTEIKPGDAKRLQDVSRDNQRIRQRSGIKQVPRSIPKLKPKAINDRIPIRRIPLSTPKKGFAGF